MTGYTVGRIEPSDHIHITPVTREKRAGVTIGPLDHELTVYGSGPDLIRLAAAVLEAAASAYHAGEGDPSGTVLARVEDARRALTGGPDQYRATGGAM